MNNPLEKTVQDVPVGKLEPKPETPAMLNTQVVEEAELHAIAHSLGIDKMSEMKRFQDQLGRVYEWAKLRGASSLTEMVTEINSLRNRVGNPNIYNLSVYAGLELERMRLEGQMKKMEK